MPTLRTLVFAKVDVAVGDSEEEHTEQHKAEVEKEK